MVLINRLVYRIKQENFDDRLFILVVLFSSFSLKDTWNSIIEVNIKKIEKKEKNNYRLVLFIEGKKEENEEAAEKLRERGKQMTMKVKKKKTVGYIMAWNPYQLHCIYVHANAEI